MTQLKIFLFLCFISLSNSKLTKPIDLTWNFDNNTLHWPNVQPFAFTKRIADKKGDSFYSTNDFCMGEHAGTHMDSPYHFNENGLKIGQIPLETLIVPGVLIDMSKEVEKHGPSTNLKKEHLIKWAKEIGHIPDKCVLLVKYGWSKYWPHEKEYFGLDDSNNFNFPGITTEAAHWIVDQKKFVGVGVDDASVDIGHIKDHPVHKILNGKGLYILENINIKPELPEKDFTLFVMPMKIHYGTGAPLRIIATPKVDFVHYD